jgi:hypothetical protein
VQEQSICSLITKPNGTSPYFTTVDKKFKNYFNHTSQQQAVYELSKHAKLLSRFSALIDLESNSGSIHTDCVQRLAYFLCSLYLPNCRAGIEMNRRDCELVVGRVRVCSLSVRTLQQNGYIIDWPPVQVDCNSFNASVVSPKGAYPSTGRLHDT